MKTTTSAEEPSSASWSFSVRNLIYQKKPKDAILIYARNRRKGSAIISVIPLVLKACSSLSALALGESFHSEIVKTGVESDVMVGTALVDMYGKCRHTASARKVFDEMPVRNVVSWNAMIGGYMRNGDVGLASDLFERMPRRTPVSWNEMIDGYARNRDMGMAGQVFSRVPEDVKNVVTWTVMVNGHVTNGDMEAARVVFDEMPVRNFFVWSVMITGYFKKGDSGKAREVFDCMGVRNLVNWNSLISGYAQNGMCEEVFDAFTRMRAEGFVPDEVTLTSVLSACAQSGMLRIGREVHDIVRTKIVEPNEFVLNGLVDMYSKCGDLENARSVFDEMPGRKKAAAWNSLITGSAIHGQSKEAVEIFRRMEGSGVKPDDVTFLSVLSACVHGGFVDVGLETFSKMEKFGVKPNVKHYGCLVDMLGRSGKLQDAFEVVKGMPMGPNETVLGAMLGACRKHSDVIMAQNVLEFARESRHHHHHHHHHHVLVSNLYAESKRWEMAEGARVVFSGRGLEKTPGCSALMSCGL